MIPLLLITMLILQAQTTVIVNTDEELEQCLCDMSSTQIYLNLSHFTLSNGSFCQLPTIWEETGSIVITTSPHINNSVINCTYVSNTGYITDLHAQGRRGLVFFNSRVIIERVTFDNCGTFLNSIPDADTIKYLNGSYFHYSAYHSAVLVFIHCTVSMTQVNITNSFGFAIIGANLYDSTISNINISEPYVNFKFSKISVGSGLLVHYYDHESTYNCAQHYSLVINAASFQKNLDYADSIPNEPLIALAYKKYSTIVNAAGLTVINTLKCITSPIINNTLFEYNYKAGCSAGGMLVIQNGSNQSSSLTINNSVFNFNINFKCHGGGLAYYWLNNDNESASFARSKVTIRPLTIYNTTFRRHRGFQISQSPSPVGARGAVFFGIINYMHNLILNLTLEKCKFFHNTNPARGNALYSVMYVRVGQAVVSLIDTTATKNSQYMPHYRSSSYSGTLYFHGIDVYVNGKSNFKDNYGSVLVGLDSVITISGEATFIGNTGVIGPAIQLQGSSYLKFTNTNTWFIRNHALGEGGAIYISSSSPTRFKCIIQINENSSSITFTNNSAGLSGNSIYTNILEPCYSGRYLDHASDVRNYYNNHFNITKRKHMRRLEISAQPQELCQCYLGHPNLATSCKIFIHVPTYPGRTVSYYMVAKDSTGKTSVYTEVNIIINSRNPSHSLDFLYNKKQYIIEKENCSFIGFKLVSPKTFHSSISADLSFSLPGRSVIGTGYIVVKPCPAGFQLHSGWCKLCSSVLSSVAKVSRCNIENGVILRSRERVANIWAGHAYYRGKKTFAASLQCPEGYCHNEAMNLCGTDDGIAVTREGIESKKFCTDNSMPLCLHNRTGALCGRCIDGYSVVFGNTECRQCSNWWLLTLIGYAIAGPLFIYLLYALKLTLTTGTINGIIFYAQMANVGMLDILKIFSHESRANIVSTIAIVCLSWTNGNAGLPVCLFDGLNETLKAGISLAFSLYLLAIVVFLIILSRYSLKISNKIADSSVQVLVTVVHFSFSKLLLSVIDVFTSAKVQTETHSYTVWFFDGSVEYGKGSHLLLMIITLVIVTALLLPYILILLFAKPLRRTRLYSYIRPCLEAIHAPYKPGKEYFFVLQLIFVIAIYVVYATYRSSNILYLYLINIPLLAIFLMFHTYCKPFKSSAANILYCWLMFNALLVGMTSWYFLIHFGVLKLISIVSSAVFLEFITFILILVYHVLWVTGKLPFIIKKVRLVYMKIQARDEEEEEASGLNYDGSFYQSVNYREAMISSIAY